jgi:hypothetical protein
MTMSRWIAAPVLLVSSVATPACVAERTDCGGSLVCGPGTAGGGDAGASDAGVPGADAGPGVGVDPGDASACRPSFASGVNVAWVRFGNDIPNPDLVTFQGLFQNAHAAGGRVARWWFHANGTVTPGYDANGMALPISSSDIADVRSILDTAYAAGMMVTISLWSFDMLKGSLKPNSPVANAALLANNVSLLTVDANRQAYIDNVLTPLVSALAGHPGLYAWETFNEPEGMAVAPGWKPFTGVRGTDGGTVAGQSVAESYIQKTINWFAAAIHAADPTALVTSGTWQFLANANVPGMMNYYSDAALVAAGGLAGGTLDFYEVHYYAANGAKVSPFANPASHWGLDKPIVIGEFYALAQDGVAATDVYTSLYNGQYGGGWAWQYLSNDANNTSNGGVSTKWPAMQAPLQALLATDPSALACP